MDVALTGDASSLGVVEESPDPVPVTEELVMLLLLELVRLEARDVAEIVEEGIALSLLTAGGQELLILLTAGTLGLMASDPALFVSLMRFSSGGPLCLDREFAS